jgi:hypothetical protein
LTRKAGREHEVVATGEIAQIGAILVHQREPLGPPIFGAGLVYEDHAAIEIALFAGQALVDRVRMM